MTLESLFLTVATNCIEILASLLDFQLSFSAVNIQGNNVRVSCFPQRKEYIGLSKAL